MTPEKRAELYADNKFSKERLDRGNLRWQFAKEDWLAGHLVGLAEGQRMREWQPIETAPKDGTYIDLHGGGRRWTDCWWNAPFWYRNDGDELYAMKCRPTHWMPLPSVPEAQP